MVVCLLPVGLFVACENRKATTYGPLILEPKAPGFTGKWIARDQGELVRECEYQDGKKHGEERRYYKDTGNLMSVIHYREGIKEGVSERYENIRGSHLISRCVYRGGAIESGAALTQLGAIDPEIVSEQDMAYEVIMFSGGKAGNRENYHTVFGTTNRGSGSIP